MDTEHDEKMRKQDSLIEVLERIADAQEKLLVIAEEARRERTSLSAKMKEAFSRPLDLPPSKGAAGV